MRNSLLYFISIILISCSSDTESSPGIITDSNNNTQLYFPPIDNSEWEQTSPESLNWNLQEIENLKSFLFENNTRGFIILKDGRIVIEEYWDNNILNTSNFNENTIWYWASAGKTITALLTGIAQEQNLLSVSDKTSDYLGSGWSSLTIDQESAIIIEHQLTMTTGLDYTVSNLNCTDNDCLTYKTDPETKWYYHNASYTLLENVISNAANTSYNDFTNTYLSNKIGISNGEWRTTTEGFNTIFWSTTKDAARFGLLLLNEGQWDQELILNDLDYFNSMTTSSQNLNISYGYLTWLNGKETISYPGSSLVFNESLSENAPADLFAAIGANGQFIDVVPSENIVVVRLGEIPSDSSLVPATFHNEMWEKINAILP